MPPRYPKIYFWLPALIWMGVIFYFSSLPAIQATAVDWQDFIIKKTAHLIEYAVLFFLLTFSLKNTTRLSRGRVLFTALFISLAYAVSDEFHQTFVSGREGRFRDVAIDGTGSLISLFLTGRLFFAPPPSDNS